ncbi:MAG TPA: hypothetical protein VG369_04640 [Humibacter sp.]|nr:hypothetical protein [Humibacter sp.]
MSDTPTTPDAQHPDPQKSEDSTMTPESDTAPTERISDTIPTERIDDAAAAQPEDATSTLHIDEPPLADRYAATATGGVRPRIRSGAIAWGVIVLAFAAAVMIVTAVPGNAAAFAAWTASLTPVAIGVLVVVAIGVLVLLFASLSAIRRAQRRSAARG